MPPYGRASRPDWGQFGPLSPEWVGRLIARQAECDRLARDLEIMIGAKASTPELAVAALDLDHAWAFLAHGLAELLRTVIEHRPGPTAGTAPSPN